MEESCPICCSNFTNQVRKKITCNMCKYDACTKCVKTYLLTTFKDPHCMKCNVGWDSAFIDDQLSKHFRFGELKKHRQEIMVDREKSLLPSTIPFVEQEIKDRELREKINDLQIKKAQLKQEMKELEIQITNLNFQRGSGSPLKNEARVYQRPCPGDDCRGYLSNWKCSLCDTKVCSKCHQIKKDDDHECKEEDVATADLLKKDTKFCPNQGCKTPIYKIEGCSQMFCTVCNTAFDWKTGEIVKNTATIHNPHYYEWLRKKNNGIIPRNVGDTPCGGLPNIWIVNEFLRKNKYNINIDMYHRGINHFIHFEVPRHPIDQDNTDIFRKLRVKYLMKEITEEVWKRELHKNFKKREKNIALRNIFDMLINVSIDMFNRIINSKDLASIKNIIIELENLRLYFNEVIYKVYDRFDSKAKKEIKSDWIFENISTLKTGSEISELSDYDDEF